MSFLIFAKIQFLKKVNFQESSRWVQFCRKDNNASFIFQDEVVANFEIDHDFFQIFKFSKNSKKTFLLYQ
jgi:hypothetical protein